MTVANITIKRYPYDTGTEKYPLSSYLRRLAPLFCLLLFYVSIVYFRICATDFTFHSTIMLNKVLLSSDVALVCMQHALSTEKEEIMGLLIGEVFYTDQIDYTIL